MAKKALTEADIAALAAGAAIEAVVEAVTEQADTTETVTAEVPNGVQEEAATEEVVEKVATTDPTVQYLQSQIKDKDSELLQAGIKLAKVEEQLAELKATVEPLLSIAVKSVTNMAVALKSAPVATLSTPAAQVLAEHARLSDLFQKQFPIGGVAAVSASNEPKKSAAYVMTNVTQAQLNAVRGSK